MTYRNKLDTNCVASTANGGEAGAPEMDWVYPGEGFGEKDPSLFLDSLGDGDVSIERRSLLGISDMAKRVNLDGMIPREDFEIREAETAIDLFQDFPITHLLPESPYLKLIRKPDFQRETNHWSPEQIATLIASFLDSEVIPSLILWKSPVFIFVLDGGHRLSALRAWIEDDYGDRQISLNFYGNEIPKDQKRIAARTRKLIEERVGRFTTLKNLVGSKTPGIETKRANILFTRSLKLQWVEGNADVAETSFFKINSQGTPLDDLETMLIRNRRKPIAISARAILRAGTGNAYWSSFALDKKAAVETLSKQLYENFFEPEFDTPLKTLDVPLGGSVSPVEALGLLIEYLIIAGTKQTGGAKPIDKYDDDGIGDETTEILNRALVIVSRMTGNTAGSMGLHPAVYFYNERGKYSRFLFLGMASLIAEKLRNNDDDYFKKFTRARKNMELFLIDNKSLIGSLTQNMAKGNRISKMRDLFAFLVAESDVKVVHIEDVITHLGVRIIDGGTTKFSDDDKSQIFISKALSGALTCTVCGGKLDPNKSVSYDHITRVSEGGTGHPANGDLVHPYCNTGIRN
ncbi:MAG: HNH endonuclease [Pseudomonadota bacterium]|nr:HNH endonuclease [Pseudomonadota bacterium]